MSAADAESRNASRLLGKTYKPEIDKLIAATNVRVTDFDQKAVHFLDFLQRRGRVAEACQFLIQAADGVGRDDILNWRAYVYTLLRKSDETAYLEMKAQSEGKSRGAPKAPKDPAAAVAPVRGQVARRGKTAAAPPPPLEDDVADGAANLNPTAPEFVPGHHWGGKLVGTTPTASSPPPFPLGVFTQPVPVSPPLAPPGAFNIPGVPPPPPAHAPVIKGQGKAKGSGKGDSKGSGKGKGKEQGKGKASEARAYPAAGAGQAAAPGELPSAGSAGHADKTCKPCAFFHTKGCVRGPQCEFCHLCGPGEKKVRKKAPPAKAQEAADGPAEER